MDNNQNNNYTGGEGFRPDGYQSDFHPGGSEFHADTSGTADSGPMDFNYGQTDNSGYNQNASGDMGGGYTYDQSAQQNYGAQQDTGAYQQQNYGDYQQNAQYAQYGQVPPAHNKAIASLVLGICGICCCGICGIVALILATSAKNEGNNEGIRTAGFVLGIVSLVLWGIMIILNIVTGTFAYYIDG